MSVYNYMFQVLELRKVEFEKSNSSIQKLLIHLKQILLNKKLNNISFEWNYMAQSLLLCLWL